MRAEFAALAALAALAGSAGASDPVQEGRNIYRSGERADGSVIEAVVAGDTPVAAAGNACIGCHRRSGLGSSEGRTRAPPVTAAALFTPPAGAARPAYDAESLARALAQGLAVDGRTLDPLMPRYRLTAHDMRALHAYLQTLGATAPAGVTDETLELATVISADVSAVERAAIEQVLNRFIEIKNAGTRREADRAAAARRHPLGMRSARAYRRWQHSIWILEGPMSTWDAQLTSYNARRPPFAILSGATGHDWRIMHAFCERHEIPCLLPITDVPVEDPPGFYSLYYSAGVRLEARVIARHIADSMGAASRTVLVIHNDDERGDTAWSALTSAWPPQSLAMLVEERLPIQSRLSYRDWQQLVGRQRPEVIVAWLTHSQFQGFASIAASAQLLPTRIYTTESFTRLDEMMPTRLLQNRLWHIFPYSLPVEGRSQFPREQFWLKTQHLDDLNTLVAAKTLFACHALGEALAAIESNFSGDYLMENLEHMLAGTGMSTLYPRTALGTGQRFLSRGAYVLRMTKTAADEWPSQAIWVQP